ncbi:sulfate permease-like protein [Aaosphaeria arxii CBS 175.79]|uniref:Sulfate permease-like protein n=1 Tax=Aaosphaeria arxii CBS 175.79 TaxID=1450172 RepID=A0A6A5XKJ3_9PLEO|nr:sulfate permease-like protein [Aaosphaeria arxii CBS 175.79]KAF2013396.1 sulfate permease-like protein [Aaosphaeria arxii CBS 175.79]
MASTTTKIGHGLAKVLGIDLHYRNETGSERITRGESVFSVTSADTYVEEEPTAMDWLREVTPSGRDIVNYLVRLFPFLNWITRYNLQWLIGDLVAGITVGAVVVPQSMAYAKLAQLPPEFGLYSSFMGVLLYWFFATSKDITIGPVAVLSTVTGNVVLSAEKKLHDVPRDIIASSLAIIAGSIVLFLGLARLGWIVDLITLAAISAFMTGSAINIAVGQVPTMMGITGFSTREATYKVAINILKHLGRSDLNAAIGLTALAMLYIIRGVCTYLGKRYPSRQKTFFFISTLRTAFVILLYILISYLVNRSHKANGTKPKFATLGKVPRGFQHARVPHITTDIISAFASELPSTVIVLLIEHISISKSFGRVNNYTIDPSQELVAIGVTNVLGPFLGAYPATGSFSRTAIKSKAGVRTPFAGVITAIVVLLAIYALPAMFWYIPNAALAGVIIHAVGDLITPPNTVYQFWRISPLEVPIFFAGVFVTIFSSIENGIYTTISVSAALWIFRAFKAKGRFLGRAKIHSVIGDHLLDRSDEAKEDKPFNPRKKSPSENEDSVRNVFLPIDHNDGSNPQIQLEDPYPGIFIYRFSEGFNYPNANHYLDELVATIFKKTRRTNPATYGRPGDRPWNDPGPRRGKEVDPTDERPTLKSIILDFSSVNNVDITSIQNLIDVRNQLDRYAAPDTVDWHFCNINNRWTKRALAAAGFGYYTPEPEGSEIHRWKPIFSVADMGGSLSATTEAEEREIRHAAALAAKHDLEHTTHPAAGRSASQSSSSEDLDHQLGASKAYHGYGNQKQQRIVVVQGLNRPLFHVDITAALNSALANAQRKSH